MLGSLALDPGGGGRGRGVSAGPSTPCLTIIDPIGREAGKLGLLAGPAGSPSPLSGEGKKGAGGLAGWRRGASSCHNEG